MMSRVLSADDIMPLVASLTEAERVRLLKWIALPRGLDATAYKAAAEENGEFSSDDELVAWDADGWDEFL